MSDRQSQDAGERSTLIQAGGNVMIGQNAGHHSTNIQGQTVNMGITVSEARQIALDVFKANALELAGIARDLFEARGRAFIEHYLEVLSRRKPEALCTFRNPDMQYAIFTAQRDSARSGDEDLSDLLIDILVDRAAEQPRNLKRIVLDEALTTAPKLTTQEYDLLSLAFLLQQTQVHCQSIEDFAEHVRHTLLPFAHNLPTGPFPCYHLQYTGCATLDADPASSFLQGLYWDNLHLFCDGLRRDEISAIMDPTPLEGRLLIPCLRDPNLQQLSEVPQFRNHRCEDMARSLGVDARALEDIIDLQHSRLFLKSDSVAAYFCELIPELVEPIRRWESSKGERLQVTSVGIAIAIANIRRTIGQCFDLDAWMDQ
jgi:hypothetical protein